MCRPWLLSIVLAACSGASTPDDADTGQSATDSGTADSGAEVPYDWPDGAQSLCDNPASIVQLTARLPQGSAAVEGDLVVAMMHRRYGSPDNGGHPHWMWTFEDQALTADTPVYAEVDMCEGNAIMWSEENCEYNLVVMVDKDGNNGLSGFRGARPSTGEPAAVEVFDMSCHAEGAYQFELTLDCVDGADCVTYEEEPVCECAEPECPSESGICWL